MRDELIREYEESKLNEAIIEFINESMMQTCKDLVQLKEGMISGLIRKSFVSFKKKDWESLDNDLTNIESTCWQKLKSGGWNHVAWREAFCFTQLMLAVRHIYAAEDSTDYRSELAALKKVDMACILGGPMEDLLLPLAAIIENHVDLNELNRLDSDQMELMRLVDTPNIPVEIQAEREIAREHNLSLEEFETKYYKEQKPVVIRGELDNWSAMNKWRDLTYLTTNFGHRTVPVEIGTHNVEEGNWHEESLTIKQFITDYMIPSLSVSSKGSELPHDRVAYLAQHPLFHHLPKLRRDIDVPQYTKLGELTNVNAWFGTCSTRTPLHFDSYQNCLAQVVGYKYVRLYSPDQTPKLYVDPGIDSTKAQGNISQVNVENFDKNKFPLFEQADYTETILGPGEILFMPANTWHYVRSLSPSFSISFWFE